MYLALYTILITNCQRQLIHYARLLSGVFLLLVITGCSHTPQTQQLVQHWPNLPHRVEIETVPFFPQQAYQCGPAALATLLGYQQIAVRPDDLVDKVYLPGRKGSLQIEMLATARQYGVIPYSMDSSLNNIMTEVAAGNPVLVFQNLFFNWYPQWHYAVIVGYDIELQQLILRSGTERRHHVSMETFERTWQRAQSWAYVMTPPNKVPETATPASYIQAIHQLEKSGLSHLAYQAYNHASMQWPDNELILMALGNVEYQLAKFDQAKNHFSAVIANNHRHSMAWNNLAYTLMALQCEKEALQAVECAAKLAPDDTNIQNSRQEIQSVTPGPVRCSIPNCPQ